MHAVLLISYHSQDAPVPGNAAEENRTIFLVTPWVTPFGIKNERTRKPSQGLQKKKLLAAPLTDQLSAPGKVAAPGEVAANDENPAIEQTANIDPNWTAGQSGNPAPVTDIRAYSLSLAGKADAQARQGKLVTLDPVDTPFKRMQSAMAQAAKGSGNSTTTAISSSGEAITIVTRSGKPHCYVPVSTSVAPSAVFDNRGSGRSTEIQCPKGMR